MGREGACALSQRHTIKTGEDGSRDERDECEKRKRETRRYEISSKHTAESHR